jgi:glycosyltransferase involved in cell wall biosynthesis
MPQDYPNRELVIVEDGDEDVSDMIRELECVRYLRSPPRSSIGPKRNLACQSARGDIIAHWDDGDWYGVGRLSHQVARLLAARTDLTGLENAFQLELVTSNPHGWQQISRPETFPEHLLSAFQDVSDASDRTSRNIQSSVA